MQSSSKILKHAQKLFPRSFRHSKKLRNLMEVIGDLQDSSEKVTAKEVDNCIEVLNKAIKNKVPLLFLQKLLPVQLARFQAYYRYYCTRWENSIRLITEVTDLFKENEINYALFKTLKPFPHAPTDVDILLRSKEDLQDSYRILSSTGQTLVAKDSFTYTLYSRKHRLDIDLYLHPTIADMIYINKDALMNHIVETNLEGSVVRTLSPEAEIIAVASHSLYKEHAYTLNDHYTLRTLLRKAKLQKVLELANETCTTTALKVSAMLSYLINEQTGTTDSRLQGLIALFENDWNPPLKPSKRQLDLPYKHNPYCLTRYFIEKIRKDALSLSTIPLLFKRGFSRRFLTLLTSRITA